MALTADNPLTWLLLLGAVACYLAVAWLPERWRQAGVVGVVSLVGVGIAVSGYAEAAIAMVSGAAVCAMALCGGLVILTGKSDDKNLRGGSSMLLLPVAVVLMYLGLRGIMDGLAVVLLGLMGIAVWAASDEPDTLADTEHPKDSIGNLALGVVCAIMLSIVVAVVWSVAISAGAGRGKQFRPEVMGMAILAPAVIFPLVGVCGQRATISQQSGVRMVCQVALQLLTLALPLVLLAGAFGQTHVRASLIQLREWMEINASAFGPTTLPTIAEPNQVRWPVYPMISWRLDTAMLVVLGMLMAGVRLGLIRCGRVSGAILVLLYVVYLVASIISALVQ